MFLTKSHLYGKMVGVVALMSLAVFATGCEPDVEDPNATITVPENVTPPEETELPVERTPIVTGPDSAIEELVGETVTVSTKVQEEFGDGVFTAYDLESMRGEEILVVSDVASPAVGSNIEVTGEVRTFDVVVIESEYGIDLSPALEAEYVDKPYIDAMAIEPVD